MGFDESSLTMQLTLLVAFLPVLAVEAACAGWALWRLPRQPREGWLLLGAIVLSGCQYLFGTSLFPLLIALVSLSGMPLNGEAISLMLSVGHLALSLASWWLILLGMFGPAPFQRGQPTDAIDTPVVVPAVLPIVFMALPGVGVLLVVVALIVASRRQRAARPRAARWTVAVIALELAVAILPWFWMSFGGLVLPMSHNIEAALNDPAVWAFVTRCWMNSLLPAAQWGLVSYLILEQPDQPRTVRVEASVV